MAALFLYSVVAILLFSAIAWHFSRKKGSWFDWDWLLCILPTAIWFALISRGIGPKNQEQIIELISITGLIPILLTLRVFVLDKLFKNAKINSLVIFCICITAPILFRLLLPGLFTQ